MRMGCSQGEHDKIAKIYSAGVRVEDYGKCCGEQIKSNYLGDIRHCQKCLNKNSPIRQQNQDSLLSLVQVQQYFIANNIHIITNQNGNLVITFNQTQTNPNSPPPSQTITDEELSETSTLMDT